MILVTVGTNGAAFDRLLRELDDLDPGNEVVVQRGPSTIEPAGATSVGYLPFVELDALVQRAHVVVTHAGVGSILVALARGHRPIVVPRLRLYSEAVDDHQLSLARRLDEDGLVVCVTDPHLVRSAVAVGSTRVARERDNGQPVPLISELSRYLASKCPGGRPPIAAEARGATPTPT